MTLARSTSTRTGASASRAAIRTRPDDAPLPMSHGFPARILIPGHYGMKGPKGSKTFLQSSLGLLRSKYKDPGMLANATANHLGIGMRQAMALLSVKIAVIVTAGQKLVKRVRGRASLGVDIQSASFKPGP